MSPEDAYVNADKELEIYNFDAAIAMFRQAAIKLEPTTRHLANLSISEHESNLNFRRNLCKKYPHSSPCKFSLIFLLISSRRFQEVIRISSEMLASVTSAETEKLIVRLFRFEAALSIPDAKLIASDFQWLWHVCANDPVASKFRNRIVNMIIACTNPALAGTFVELSHAVVADAKMANFLSAKSDELRFAYDVIQ